MRTRSGALTIVATDEATVPRAGSGVLVGHVGQPIGRSDERVEPSHPATPDRT